VAESIARSKLVDNALTLLADLAAHSQLAEVGRWI